MWTWAKINTLAISFISTIWNTMFYTITQELNGDDYRILTLESSWTFPGFIVRFWCCCKKGKGIKKCFNEIDRYDPIDYNHGLRTPREEIAFNARPKIQSQSQIFRYGGSIFCLPHRPKFSDIFDLCLHWVSVVRDLAHN